MHESFQQIMAKNNQWNKRKSRWNIYREGQVARGHPSPLCELSLAVRHEMKEGEFHQHQALAPTLVEVYFHCLHANLKY